MEYKISYVEYFNDYHYNQRFKLVLTENELSDLNAHLEKASLENFYIKTIKSGLNFTNLSTSKEIAKHFNFDKDKRFLDRNTAVLVLIK